MMPCASAVLGQHGKLVAAQPRQGHAGAQLGQQAFAHGLEQLVAGVVAEAVVDALEVVQVQQQQGTAALVGLGRSQGLLDPVVEQQAVGQVGERVVVNQVRQLALGVLDRADVAEHRHVVGQLAAVVVNGADGLPLRVDLAVLAPVPDFAAPFALLGQGGEYLLVERGVVAARLELARALAQHLVLLVAGDLHERPVDVHDQAVAVAHQHPFEGAVEHRCGHAQALAVLAAQARAHADEIEQAPARHKDQRSAAAHPRVGVDQLPACQLGGIIEKIAQYLIRQHQPHDRQHQIQRGHTQGVSNGYRHRVAGTQGKMMAIIGVEISRDLLSKTPTGFI
jgi:hypothetical protein